MYEALTAFIPFMQSGHFGTWSKETIFRHVDYDEQINDDNRTAPGVQHMKATKIYSNSREKQTI